MVKDSGSNFAMCVYVFFLIIVGFCSHLQRARKAPCICESIEQDWMKVNEQREGLNPTRDNIIQSMYNSGSSSTGLRVKMVAVKYGRDPGSAINTSPAC